MNLERAGKQMFLEEREIGVDAMVVDDSMMMW